MQKPSGMGVNGFCCAHVSLIWLFNPSILHALLQEGCDGGKTYSLWENNSLDLFFYFIIVTVNIADFLSFLILFFIQHSVCNAVFLPW